MAVMVTVRALVLCNHFRFMHLHRNIPGSAKLPDAMTDSFALAPSSAPVPIAGAEVAAKAQTVGGISSSATRARGDANPRPAGTKKGSVRLEPNKSAAVGSAKNIAADSTSVAAMEVDVPVPVPDDDGPIFSFLGEDEPVLPYPRDGGGASSSGAAAAPADDGLLGFMFDGLDDGNLFLEGLDADVSNLMGADGGTKWPLGSSDKGRWSGHMLWQDCISAIIFFTFELRSKG